MARLYSDENFPLRTVLELRKLGHDVLTVAEAGHASQGIADAFVLQFAIAEEKIIVTLDRNDFIRLHRQFPDHRRIVVCSNDLDRLRLA